MLLSSANELSVTQVNWHLETEKRKSGHWCASLKSVPANTFWVQYRRLLLLIKLKSLGQSCVRASVTVLFQFQSLVHTKDEHRCASLWGKVCVELEMTGHGSQRICWHDTAERKSDKMGKRHTIQALSTGKSIISSKWTRRASKYPTNKVALCTNSLCTKCVVAILSGATI